MSRRKQAPKRVILPDPLFHSELLAKFMNAVMCSGKKSVAERIVYGALNIVVQKIGHGKREEAGSAENHAANAGALGSIHDSERARKLALGHFKTALDNIMPSVEVKSRRVGGSTYQVPVEIRLPRRMALAMRWLVEYSNRRNEKTMILRLAHEIIDALDGRGGAVKKREDVHRMAKANQAFAHYHW